MADDDTRDPKLVKEAQRLVERLRPMIERTNLDKSELVSFTMEIPKQYAILGAFLTFKADREGEGKTGPLPRTVKLFSDDGEPTQDWTRARDYFRAVISAGFSRHYRRLQEFAYPQITHDDEPAEEVSSIMDATDYKPYEPDDDIPF